MERRPSPYTTSLETFDPLELLFMLGRSQRSGLLRVMHRKGELHIRLCQGRVCEVSLGALHGAAALAVVVADPRGHFAFEDAPGVRGPLNLRVEALALAALRELPAPEPLFDGPAKFSDQLDEADLELTLAEERALAALLTGPALSSFTDPEARALAGRLSRLGVLVPRKARVARLTVAVDRGLARSALLDETILARWREDVGEAVRAVAVRSDAGRVVSFAVRAQPGLGHSLVLPREWLLQYGLRSGESVLARPG